MDGLKMKYFVLKPAAKTHDDPFAKASQEAMLVYADNIECVNPELADELRKWTSMETMLQARMKD